MTGMTPAPRPSPGPVPLAAQAAASIGQVLAEYPSWSVFWDQHAGVWRAAEDDPDSGLYAASSDPGTVIAYIRAHS